MILDKQNILSEDQAITVSAVATNVIDLGADSDLVQDLNEKAGNVDIFFQVTEAFAGGTSLKVSICDETDPAFADANNAIVNSAVVVTASLVAGYKFRVSVPEMLVNRYLGAYYTVVGTMTAGKIFAALSLDNQTNG